MKPTKFILYLGIVSILIGTVLGLLKAGSITEKIIFPDASEQTTAGGGGGVTNYMMRADQFAAFGSTATATIRFGVLGSNTFPVTVLDYTTNAAGGSKFTLLKAGTWSGVAHNASAASSPIAGVGWSIDAVGTEIPYEIMHSNLLARQYTTVPVGAVSISGATFPPIFLPSGAVLRVHGAQDPATDDYADVLLTYQGAP